MRFFWYQSEKLLPDGWTRVFFETIHESQKFRAHIRIIGHSHQVNLYFNHRQFCEALTTQKPEVNQEEFLGFDLTNNQQYTKPNLQLWVSADFTAVKNFLEQTGIVKYDFGQEAWTAVQLTENRNWLWVQTLHCYPELNLVIWSKTKYSL